MNSMELNITICGKQMTDLVALVLARCGHWNVVTEDDDLGRLEWW